MRVNYLSAVLCAFAAAAAAAALGVAAAHPVVAAAAAPGPPNFVWIITDDQDDLLGSYAVMPNVRRYLIEGGRKFTNAMVAAPKCCPSRTSALSGRFPHGLNDRTAGWCGDFETTENTTFVARLRAAGYTTGLAGKYYNEENVFCGANIHVPSAYTSFFAMCQEVTYYNMSFNDDGRMVHHGQAPTDYLTAVLGNRTLSFLQNATGATSAREKEAAAAEAAGADASGAGAEGASAPAALPPFYMYFAPHAPHLPATPAPWYANVSMPAHAPRTPNWNVGMADKHWAVASNGPMDDYFTAASDTLYGDRLRTLMSVDDAVGAIFETLAAAGVADNTYVIFTSDHGYHLGQFGLWAEKSQPYETDVHIPFIIAGPGVPPNTTSDALVSPLDVGATLLELAGLEAPGARSTDGRSIVPLLGGGTAEGGSGVVATVGGSGGATAGGAPAPAAWPRDRLLIEFFGWSNEQYLEPCTTGPDGVPGVPCPQPASAVTPLIDSPSNTFAALRILNATHNFLYAEYRAMRAPLVPASTNFTEAYDVSLDPWQLNNLAVDGKLPPGMLAQLSAELWAVATCTGAACP